MGFGRQTQGPPRAPHTLVTPLEGVHAHTSECLRGTRETKGWEPLL